MFSLEKINLSNAGIHCLQDVLSLCKILDDSIKYRRRYTLSVIFIYHHNFSTINTHKCNISYTSFSETPKTPGFNARVVMEGTVWSVYQVDIAT